MKLDFAIFEPNNTERAIAAQIFEFSGRGSRRFSLADLLADDAVVSNSASSQTISEWLQKDRTMVVIGDIVCTQADSRWECESVIEGTPHYYSLRLLPDALRVFGEETIASDDPAFVT